jgi:hypothetical protein
MKVQLFNSRQGFRSFALIENIVQATVPDGIEHHAMLVAQTQFLLLVGKTTGQLVPVGSRVFPDAAAAHKYLGLQQQLAFARLALHVVDGVSLFDICVKTEDHALPFTGPKKILPIVLIH